MFLILFGVGVFLLVQVLLPIIAFKIWEMTVYQQNSPLISAEVSNQTVAGISIEDRDSFPALISSNKRSDPPPYPEFSLTIPSIKLEKVKVVVETNDFEQNLAHLPGTALPGEKGNVFITGHSSLTQLYSPRNYKAIFANLPKVNRSDQIQVEVGGQTFNYQVVSLKVVDPKDTGVVYPPDPSGRYLTLMTCVPPGLYLKRLVVLAELR